MARLVKDMQGKDETRKHLGLLVVGELGRQTDLSRVKNLQVGVWWGGVGLDWVGLGRQTTCKSLQVGLALVGRGLVFGVRFVWWDLVFALG